MRDSVKDVLGLRHILFLLFLNFLIFLAFNLFYASFPIHATNELGWSVKGLGVFFSFLGVTTVVAQGPILGFLGSRYSDGALTVAGGLVLGTGLTLLGGGEFAVIYAAATLFSVGNGLMWPSFQSLLSKAAPVEYHLNYAQIRRSHRRWSCGGSGSGVNSIMSQVVFSAVSLPV